MFESNYLAIDRCRSVRSTAFQLIFLGLPLGGLIAFVMYLANENRHNAQVFILIVIVPYTLFATFFVGYATILMIKRWNRTINKIDIESGNLSAETFPIFWYKSKRYVIKVSDVILNNTTFPWYGKEKKEGIVIKVGKEELYFVKDYFDDYESILNSISSN